MSGEDKRFHAGFVNIIGKPNVGKSTLINAILGEKISIVSHKVQTTRHRILGILNGDNYQMVFSDTPGIISKPKYMLHDLMMKSVKEAIEDADVIVYMIEATDAEEHGHAILHQLMRQEVPVLIVINKIDLLDQEQTVSLLGKWGSVVPEERVIPVSALKNFNIQKLIDTASALLPESPPYFPADQYTDKSERFLAAEVIREKIFHHFHQEVPYSTDVVVTEFKETDILIRISAEIFVERQSQKGILIGKGGEALKKIGTLARQELEAQLDKKIFLELFIKVREKWRENKRILRGLGFES